MRCAPAGAEIVAGNGGKLGGAEMCFVVSAGDVMEAGGIRRPSADRVDSGVDKADR